MRRTGRLEDPSVRAVRSSSWARRCGQTELAKTLADSLRRRGRTDQLDMSEYMEKHRVAPGRLSPGYVGYEEGVSSRGGAAQAFSVVLFDEVEKATPTCSTHCCRSWRTVA